jgi:hypothetical protein
VVLINHERHSEYEQEATRYKDVVAEMFGVKTISEFNIEYTSKLREIGKPNAILLSTMHSLFKTHDKIDRETKIGKLKQIADGTGLPLETVLGYNYIQLYKFYQLLRKEHIKEQYEFKQANRIHYDHGYHLVQKLDSEEKIENFVKLWRKHFIDTMKPEFMPNGWSVDFRVKTNI